MNEPNLTPDQLRAILTIDRHLCIRAGAGCGKTGVLAYHYVALLLLKSLRPSEIVAVTFTEKAAGELKDRIQRYLRQGMEGRLPFQDRIALKPAEIELLLEEIPQAPISTLHGLAGKIVRDVSLLTGFDPHFEILDENQAHALKYEALNEGLAEILKEPQKPFKDLIHHYGWQNLKSQMQTMLEDWPRWKEASLNEEDADGKETWQTLREIFLQILNRYEAKKLSLQALDFNDLEEEALKLLAQFPLVIRHYRKLWKAYLIDEFQDTNESQDRLISMLLEIDEGKGERGNGKREKKTFPLSPFPSSVSPFPFPVSLPLDRHLAIVGDEKQSIYAFRGAEPHIFEKFQSIIEQSGGLTVTLSKNFRSPPLLLDWVNTLFSAVFPQYPPLNTDRSDPRGAALEVLSSPLIKKLPLPLAGRGQGEGDSSKKLPAEERRKLEAKMIGERVSCWLQEGTPAQDIFVLFRTLSSVSIYLKAFRELQIPVYVKSSQSLLDRQEILDLIHAMKTVVDPENPISWVGLLRSPAISLSDEELLKEALQNKELSWKSLSPLTINLSQRDKTEGPYDFLNWFLEETQLVSLYTSTSSLSLKAQNILQFLEFAYQWQLHHSGGLTEFVKELNLFQDNQIHFNSLSDKLGLGEAVTLMTIHQAKGLDFPIVILPDLSSKGKNDRIPIADQWKGKVGLRLPVTSAGLKRDFEESETLQEIREEKKTLSLEEENRIFYVAATRAEEKILLGFPPEEEENKARAPALSLLRSSLAKNSRVKWVQEDLSSSMTPTSNPSEPLLRPFQALSKVTRTHFAVTQLECYLRSPEEYRERYVYGIPQEDFPERKVKIRSEELEVMSEERKDSPFQNLSPLTPHPSPLTPLDRGNLIHETLCLITQTHRAWKLREALQAAWTRHLIPENEELFRSLEESLERTLVHPSFHEIMKAEEGHSEIPFLLSLYPYEIRGAMDRLIRRGKTWTVVDYKTHKINVAPNGRPPIKKIAQDFEFQMKTYCLAASRMVGKEVGHAMIYFVEPNLTYEFSFTPSDLRNHEERLREVMEEINQMDDPQT